MGREVWCYQLLALEFDYTQRKAGVIKDRRFIVSSLVQELQILFFLSDSFFLHIYMDICFQGAKAVCVVSEIKLRIE